MSYDEHLISMAGGDGDSVNQLAAIEARIHDCQSYNFGMRNANKLAHEDVPALLALVREQQAKLDRAVKLADWAGHRGWHIAPATLRNTINEASA